MASTSSTFASASAHFLGPKVTIKKPSSVPTRVQFRPFRISAASCTSTAERTISYSAAFPSSLYEVLGIQKGATCQEIKAAYRSLARVLHPDVSANGQTHEFIKVHEAYSTLSDPEKRADYDRTLFRPKRSCAVSASAASMSSSMASVFSGYTRRTWETDQCW
ncbi:hypothetical protein REPUB_Repub19eG0016300 [Reevesia pubescens]